MNSDSTNRQRRFNNTPEQLKTKRMKSLKTLMKTVQKTSSTNTSGLSKRKMMDPEAPINKFRRGRQAQGRDTKILITSRNSTTGTGKTTLAVWLALCWDHYGFDESKATLEPSEYIDRYLETRPGEVLIMDEAEQLDARRSMSSQNVDFADRWQQLRYRQVDSILTLPTSSALDKRLEELADIWINVTSRGYAQVHKTTVNDRTKEINQIPLQTITWPDISDHEVKLELDAKKKEKNKEQNKIDKKKEEMEDPKKVKQKAKAEYLKAFYEKTDLTQKDIANGFDLTV